MRMTQKSRKKKVARSEDELVAAGARASAEQLQKSLDSISASYRAAGRGSLGPKGNIGSMIGRNMALAQRQIKKAAKPAAKAKRKSKKTTR